jgi:hypothetical protein
MSIERLKGPEHFFKNERPSTDFDGVLVNSRKVVVEEFNRMFGTTYSEKDIHQWAAITRWAIELGYSKEEAREIDDYLWYQRPDLLFMAPPIGGALEFTRWFAERGIILPIITSRTPDLKDCTITWVEKWMDWISPDQVMIRRNNEMSGEIFKVWMINLLDRGIHFEDALAHTKMIFGYTDSKVVLLSNSLVLDHYPKDRLIRVPGEDGGIPNLVSVNNPIDQCRTILTPYQAWCKLILVCPTCPREKLLK